MAHELGITVFLGFCCEFAQATSFFFFPYGAQANARVPAWRLRAAVLAATAQQVRPVLCPLRCPNTLSVGVGIRLRRLERPNMQGRDCEPTGRGQRAAGPSAGTLHGRGIVCKRRERGRRAAGHVWNDELSRNSATSTNYEPPPTSTERVCSGRPTDALPLEAMGMLARDLQKQHRFVDQLAVLAVLALVMSYDLFTQPSENIENLEPRRRCS